MWNEIRSEFALEKCIGSGESAGIVEFRYDGCILLKGVIYVE